MGEWEDKQKRDLLEDRRLTIAIKWWALLAIKLLVMVFIILPMLIGGLVGIWSALTSRGVICFTQTLDSIPTLAVNIPARADRRRLVIEARFPSSTGALLPSPWLAYIRI